MTQVDGVTIPEDKKRDFHRAMRWEWFTIVYMAIAAVLVYLTTGSSQTMRTAFIEDVLSLVPPIGFIVAQKVIIKRVSRKFPYGHYRANTLAFLLAAAALVGVGIFLVIENGMTLLKGEHPHIGTVTIQGQVVWMGWLMIGALVYSTAAPVMLGIIKQKMARSLHDKVLFTDSQMNKADWLSGVAAICGILGVGLGFWWADATAALIISVDILHDGFSNLKTVFADLMDREPTTYDHKKEDPVPKRVEEALRRMRWVQDVRLRMRENGNYLYGEAFVVPTDLTDLPRRFAEARDFVKSLDWRIQEIVFVPVLDPGEYPSNSMPPQMESTQGQPKA